jgi:hypothetical protein
VSPHPPSPNILPALTCHLLSRIVSMPFARIKETWRRDI